MTLQEKAHEMGVKSAQHFHNKKLAGVESPSKIRSFLNLLSGKTVDPILKRQQQNIMNIPHIARIAKKRPEDLAPFKDYVKRILRGNEYIPKLKDFPARMRHQKNRDTVRLLNQGRKAVRQERASVRNARLGTGGTAAAAGLGSYALFGNGPSGTPPALKTSAATNTDESNLPMVSGISASAAPTIQGIHSKALRVRPFKGQRFSDVVELRKTLNPGDILTTSHAGFDRNKALITAVGGDPYRGYHVSSVTDVPKNTRRGIRFIESSTDSGAAWRGREPLSPQSDYVIKRFKDPRQAKTYLKNLEAFAKKERLLEDLLGPTARGKMYDTSTSVKGALGSFLPSSVQKAITGKKLPDAGKAVCSSLTGICSPVPLAKNVPKQQLLPHHILSSSALKTVGHYTAPRTFGQKFIERALQASPWLVRGALGAGLGYGAYKGIKALTD